MEPQETGNMLQIQKGGHYSKECDEEDTVKASNKKGSSFLELEMYKWRCINIEEQDKKESKESEDYVEGSSEGSHDAEYEDFPFWQYNIV